MSTNEKVIARGTGVGAALLAAIFVALACLRWY